MQKESRSYRLVSIPSLQIDVTYVNSVTWCVVAYSMAVVWLIMQLMIININTIKDSVYGAVIMTYGRILDQQTFLLLRFVFPHKGFIFGDLCIHC